MASNACTSCIRPFGSPALPQGSHFSSLLYSAYCIIWTAENAESWPALIRPTRLAHRPPQRGMTPRTTFSNEHTTTAFRTRTGNKSKSRPPIWSIRMLQGQSLPAVGEEGPSKQSPCQMTPFGSNAGVPSEGAPKQVFLLASWVLGLLPCLPLRSRPDRRISIPPWAGRARFRCTYSRYEAVSTLPSSASALLCLSLFARVCVCVCVGMSKLSCLSFFSHQDIFRDPLLLLPPWIPGQTRLQNGDGEGDLRWSSFSSLVRAS